MISLKIIGRKIIFLRNCIAQKIAYIFISILNFIFTSFDKIKMFEKNLKALKKILSMAFIFMNFHYARLANVFSLSLFRIIFGPILENRKYMAKKS